jgi:exodeoxyribonuclease V alpha subunit
VEAGAVFRDLDPLALRLTRSFRMDPAELAGRHILEVAQRVRAGDAALAAHVEERGAAAAVAFTGVEQVAAGAREALLERWYAERIAPSPGFAAAATHVCRLDDAGFAPEDAAWLDALHAHYQTFRLLCVTRARPTGVEATNAWLHRRLDGGAAAFHPGEPVLMLRNDYERGLWNGDQGLVVRIREAGESRARTAVTWKTDGRWIAWDLASVRDTITLAFALTVHKAQGSEFDDVGLILPEAPLPILSRELLYTAITRSRRGVVICGAPAVLAAAVAHTHARSSGIAEKLRAP